MNHQSSWAVPPKDYFFDQKLNHFDPLVSQTFKQRFWMNDTFSDGKRFSNSFFHSFSELCSLLLAFGGEAPLQDFYGVSGNILADIAAQHKMMLVYIEHRSIKYPTRSNNSKVLWRFSPKQRLLNSQSSTLDNPPSIRRLCLFPLLGKVRRPQAQPRCKGHYNGMFLQWNAFRSNIFSPIPSTHWIAFFRQKYSWLTVGAIAGSAPVNAQLNFEDYTKTVAAGTF